GVDGDDSGMDEAGGGAGFALEAGTGDGAHAGRQAEDLEGDEALELAVPGAVDDGAGAFAQATADLEAGKGGGLGGEPGLVGGEAEQLVGAQHAALEEDPSERGSFAAAAGLLELGGGVGELLRAEKVLL